jgi:hypothetical protein
VILYFNKENEGTFMADHNDNRKRELNSTSNMNALQTAVVNGEEERLKALLTNQLFDELQKSHLINLAEQNGHSKIVKLLKETPATP